MMAWHSAAALAPEIPMISRSFVAVVIMSIAIAGCGPSKPIAPDANHFVLTEDEILTVDTMVVRQFHLVAARPCRVSVMCDEGGKDTSRVWLHHPNDDQRYHACVTVAVALEPSRNGQPGRLHADVRVRRESGGGAAGGPTWRNVEFSSLEKHIEFDADAGRYPIGEPLRLGSLRDNPIEIVVEALP